MDRGESLVLHVESCSTGLKFQDPCGKPPRDFNFAATL